ncbi:hypothetical protein [Paeniglutamicibacter sp. NPDC091659]|uniref:DUF7507 domain-containing protein n=1 Tax=Paeniglutamicibacter sp. NPDC091659 TaxID=3364389 RepID=UPI00381BFE2B
MIQHLKILGNLMSHKPVRSRRFLLPAAVATAMAVAFATLPAAIADQAGAAETLSSPASSATPSSTPSEVPEKAAAESAPSDSAVRFSEAPATESNTAEVSSEATASVPAAPTKQAIPSRSALPPASSTFTERVVELQSQTTMTADASVAAAASVQVGVPSEVPGSDQAKLIVEAAGDRISASAVAPAKGAVFEFFTVSNDSVTGGTSVGTCQTDAQGRCGLITPLPLTGGKNNKTYKYGYFYAVGQSNATWSAADNWGNSNSTLIRFNSGEIRGTYNTGDRTVQLRGEDKPWPFVRRNPSPPQKCGIKMAVVFDLSYSIQQSGTLSAYKDAGTSFVDSLKGTPSEIALKTFASRAPAQGTANASVGLTSVAQPAGAEALKSKINGFTIPQSSSDYYTNWDAGLSQIEPGYDVVLFLTDGEPTRYGANASGSGTSATLQSVEPAVYSANQVKAGVNGNGAKVIAVGIGMGSGTSLAADKQRLELISGTDEGSDYFTTEFSNLGQTLKTMATKDCLGTVTVVKEIQEPTGGNTPGNDWTFSSSTTSVTAGEGTSATGQTDANGALNFKVGGFTTGSNTESRNVTIAETQKTDFELVKQGKFNATCTNVSTGAAMVIADSGLLGFTVPVKKSDVISCTVINKKLASKISIVKTAAAYNGGKPVTGPDNAPNVPSGTSVTWTYTVTNTGTTTLKNIVVQDDPVGTATCTKTTLAPAESTTCTATGSVKAQQ